MSLARARQISSCPFRLRDAFIVFAPPLVACLTLYTDICTVHTCTVNSESLACIPEAKHSYLLLWSQYPYVCKYYISKISYLKNLIDNIKTLLRIFRQKKLPAEEKLFLTEIEPTRMTGLESLLVASCCCCASAVLKPMATTTTHNNSNRMLMRLQQ